MAQLTPQGYRLKTQNDWFADERGLYLEIDPNWNLDPSTPDGLKIAHDAEIFSALDESLQQAYNSKDPDKARAIELDIVSAITGTRRSLGTPSTVNLTFQGNPGAQVLAEAIVESVVTGQRWIIPQTYTVGIDGTIVVPARATNIGPVQAEIGSITRIITTMTGITGVNNLEVATPGTDIETDSALRIKRKAAVGRPGNNQVGSLLGELYAVEGVRRARVYENVTNSATVEPTFNPHGLPAHSIGVIVDGGDDEDVAFAFYTKKNPGTFMADTGVAVDVSVTDPDYPTNIQPIRFNRPIYVDMVIAVEIVDPKNSLPENVEDLIRDAFLEFATGSLVESSSGFRDRGFDIGESVPFGSLYTPINHVIEPYGNAYVNSLTVNGFSANQVIAYNELSRWIDTNITVTVTA